MSEDAAREFARYWHERGYEKGETSKFWLALLHRVLNVAEPEKIIDFEKPVKIDEQTKYIDGYIARTKVLIEQKKLGEDLLHGTFEQGKNYADNLPYSERPRWIVTCNFAEFYIYDLVDMYSLEYLLGIKNYQPMHFQLYELRYFYPKLKFLVDPNITDVKPEIKISNDAARIVDTIYSAFEKNYKRARVNDYKNFLDKLCTRLVFCFYAAYAQIFDREKFFGYLKKSTGIQQRLDALQKIFDVLNTPENQRDNFDAALKNFPHVNGGLFEEKILLPTSNRFDGDPIDTIFAADNPEKLNWRKISPPIFGAMFESIITGKTRRAGGMHYTSVENIHKVIDPLFLDDLHEEFIAAKNKRIKNRAQALLDLQNKIAALTFLDPAAGSGNFLTETYLSLRRLENEILEELHPLINLPDNPVKVSINQFYGIEINSFAVAVAQTALWIAENQMLQETEGAIGKNLQALPLKNYATIICANALRVDWKKIIPNSSFLIPNYIIGNPPFIGYSNQSTQQKSDMRVAYGENPKVGKIDYVAAWYRKVAEFIRGTDIRCAFVSTNSITQGEQCADVWKILYEKFNVHVDFAHRTFKWLSDSDNMAHVHCVVVGFSSAPNLKPKKIFDGDKVHIADNINFYLTDGEIVFVGARANPVQEGVPKMISGNRLADGGNLIIEADDLDTFLRLEPAAKKYIKRLIGTEEFLNGKKRYCLWLENFPLDEIKNFPLIDERVEACRQDRLKGAPDRQKLAKTPHLFRETLNPDRCLVVPETFSERRVYVAMSFIDANTITTNSLHIIPDAEIYHFGILTSSIHMAWLRVVGGRLESRYRYSAKVVYNNFI